MGRRRGCTGTSAPAIRPTRAAAGPAALTTIGAAMAPFVVVTPVTRPPAVAAPGCAAVVSPAGGGHQPLRLVRRDDADVDAAAPLQRHALLEALEVGRVGDEEEVADLLVAGIDAELLLEPLEHRDGLQREAHLSLGGELGADAAGRLAGGAAADGLALDHDDVTQTATGQMV